MVVLPQALPAAAGWQMHDLLSNSFRSAPAAGGLATIDCGQLEPDQMWLVDRMVVQCSSTSPTTLRLYDTIAGDGGRVLDGASAGNWNTGEWSAGLLIRPSTSLVAQWSGASDGAIATVTLQARVMKRV